MTSHTWLKRRRHTLRPHPSRFGVELYAASMTGARSSSYVTDPSAIPADFNLVAFFDPRALGAAFAVKGFTLWEDGATAPRTVNLKGMGFVPIWFFDSAQWGAMLADGIVTMPELEANGPIKGHASFYREVVFPAEGGAPRNGLHLVSRGPLDAGGSFRFELQAPDPPFLPANGSIVLDR